ncbi:response regulator [Paenibacillus alkaliterrae]|uniref:response regulator n=1 Tax=Paenibacillus alkaliterrae TaxID=320909 RepID=UPI001F1D99DD|nr:response regulator [Paenibacillus alkaliterrae]MCF2941562.1 response regulator [Paenibacillus alkaliterrae]
MKALIVDDERHVREAIHLLVDWESHGIREIREATDGETAINVIRAWKPEIIFTDMMMPGMDGCELLTWIQEHAPNSKTIVISGHDDFRLVRHTMNAGGLDYILKPIDADQLEEAVKQAVALWTEEDFTRNEQQSRNIEVNLLKPIYWEKMFTDLLQHPNAEGKLLSDIRREFPELATASVCSCSVISLHALDERIQTKYNNHRDLLFFSLTNICNEFLRNPCTGLAFRYWATEEEIVLLHWSGLDGLEERVYAINQAFQDTLGARFDIGIGTARPFPREVQYTYKEAKTALQQRNLDAPDSRIYLFGETGDFRVPKERNVIAEIQKYMEEHYNTDLPLQHIAAKFFLSREYISRRFKEKTGVNISEYLEQIRIEKAKLYLLNPGVKISQIAEMVGYQDEKYFSRVFKKLTGRTPNEYRKFPH